MVSLVLVDSTLESPNTKCEHTPLSLGFSVCAFGKILHPGNEKLSPCNRYKFQMHFFGNKIFKWHIVAVMRICFLNLPYLDGRF
jgi:hypothetical protein